MFLLIKQQQMQMQQEYTLDSVLKRKSSQIAQFPQLCLKYSYSAMSNNSTYSFTQCAEESTKFETRFILADQLYNDILEQVARLQETWNIDEAESMLYIWYCFDWNQESLCERYSQNEWKEFLIRGQARQPVQQEGECGVCLSSGLVFSTGFCNHYYCQSCWQGHIGQQLNQGKVFFGCMQAPSCQRAPVLPWFVRSLAEQYSELYRKRVCRNHAVGSRDISYCFREKCPYYCVKDQMYEKLTIFCKCGELYCFRCNNQAHEPLTCKQVKEWNKLINSQGINVEWIKNNTMECPKCAQPIEKKVGCSHMKCLCQCEFCYECSQQWDEAHKKNHNQCPKRPFLKSKEKQTSSMIELNEYLAGLMLDAEKDKRLLSECESIVDGDIRQNLFLLREEVLKAWLQMKWIKVGTFLLSKPQIEYELQKSYLESIRGVMERVSYIHKNFPVLEESQLRRCESEVLYEKEQMMKNSRTWMAAWEEYNQKISQ